MPEWDLSNVPIPLICKACSRDRNPIQTGLSSIYLLQYVGKTCMVQLQIQLDQVYKSFQQIFIEHLLCASHMLDTRDAMMKRQTFLQLLRVLQERAP